MKHFFQYNWQVREEWFEWCRELPPEVLLEKRTGGVGSILHTLLHIVSVEYDWIQDLAGGKAIEINEVDFTKIEDVIALQNRWRPEVEDFINNWSNQSERRILILEEGKRKFTYGEVIRHIIAHEIHHIGQLSVWARELGRKPVSANFIGRNIVD